MPRSRALNALQQQQQQQQPCFSCGCGSSNCKAAAREAHGAPALQMAQPGHEKSGCEMRRRVAPGVTLTSWRPCHKCGPPAPASAAPHTPACSPASSSVPIKCGSTVWPSDWVLVSTGKSASAAGCALQLPPAHAAKRSASSACRHGAADSQPVCSPRGHTCPAAPGSWRARSSSAAGRRRGEHKRMGQMEAIHGARCPGSCSLPVRFTQQARRLTSETR